MSNGLTVTIDRSNNQITISPARLKVPYAGGLPQTVTWSATNCIITNIQILTGDGSVQPPQRINDQTWEAIDINTNKGTKPVPFTYAITIDPEIMNDPEPPPGGEDGD